MKAEEIGVGPKPRKWWLSFVEETEDRFIGVAVVEAMDFGEAVRVAHASGCNPGGQVAGWEFSDEMTAEGAPENRLPLCKLLSKEDLRSAGVVGISLAEWRAAVAAFSVALMKESGSWS